LYKVVRDNLETLYGAIGDGAIAVRIPKHARKELEASLGCGLLCPRFCPAEVRGVRGESAGGVQLQGPGEGRLGAKSGAVTVVQRTSSDLRLNPHLHLVVLDGAWYEDGGELAWEGLGHLGTREVGEVLERLVRRIERHLRRCGLLGTFGGHAGGRFSPGGSGSAPALRAAPPNRPGAPRSAPRPWCASR
jgi:hypothetical protein